MVFIDTLSDTLTRIRNGQIANKSSVVVLYSKLSIKVLDVLVREGYIRGFRIITPLPEAGLRSNIKKVEVFLKYYQKVPILREIKRISKPGRRVYLDLPSLWSNQYSEMPGFLILSTNKGIMTNKEALKACVGGEVLLQVK